MMAAMAVRGLRFALGDFEVVVFSMLAPFSFRAAVQFWPGIALTPASPVPIEFGAKRFDRQLSPVAHDPKLSQFRLFVQVRQNVANSTVPSALQKLGQNGA